MVCNQGEYEDIKTGGLCRKPGKDTVPDYLGMRDWFNTIPGLPLDATNFLNCPFMCPATAAGSIRDDLRDKFAILVPHNSHRLTSLSTHSSLLQAFWSKNL